MIPQVFNNVEVIHHSTRPVATDSPVLASFGILQPFLHVSPEWLLDSHPYRDYLLLGFSEQQVNQLRSQMYLSGLGLI